MHTRFDDTDDNLDDGDNNMSERSYQNGCIVHDKNKNHAQEEENDAPEKEKEEEEEEEEEDEEKEEEEAEEKKVKEEEEEEEEEEDEEEDEEKEKENKEEEEEEYHPGSLSDDAELMVREPDLPAIDKGDLMDTVDDDEDGDDSVWRNLFLNAEL